MPRQVPGLPLPLICNVSTHVHYILTYLGAYISYLLLTVAL